MRRRLVPFIAVVQSVLFLAHSFIYKTWTFSHQGSESGGAAWVKLALGILSVSFIAASMLAFRYTKRSSALFTGLPGYMINGHVEGNFKRAT